MTGMSAHIHLHQPTWHADAPEYLAMWMVMMVPMMLPSLVPMLVRYRRSVRGADSIRLHGLTALVGVGYYGIWVVLGAAAYAASVGLLAIELRWEAMVGWLPLASGVLLLIAGAVQFTSWKARQLAHCREDPEQECAPRALRAWKYGLRLGARCSLACGSLMLALLAIGMMNLAAMIAVTLAITAERLAPAPLRVAHVAGAAMVVAGVVTIARV